MREDRRTHSARRRSAWGRAWALALSAVIAACCTVPVTYAYLTSSTPTITNRFTAEVAPAPSGSSATVNIVKSVSDNSGQTLSLEGYEFALYELETDGSAKFAESAKSDSAGKAGFTLSYSADDIGETFRYGLSEVNGGKTIAGMEYDDAVYTIEVAVDDDGQGNAVAAASVNGGTPGGSVTVGFTNVYDPADASLTIRGAKVLGGASIADYAGAFEFDLYEADAGFAVEEGAQPVGAAVNDGSGAFAFGGLSFSKVGTYRYVAVEDASGALEGVTYDQSAFRIEVTVADEGGQLVASARYLDTVLAEYVGGIVFENAYAEPGTDPDDPVTPPVDPDDPDTPVGPDDPVDPDDPVVPPIEPEDPEDPENPDGPSDPDDPQLPDAGGDADGPAIPGQPGGGAGMGQTGDAATFAAVALAALAALAAAAVAVFAAIRMRRR